MPLTCPRFVRAVALRSGGEISLAIEARPKELSPRDASFVLSLIDLVDRYQAESRARPQPPPEEAPHHA